MHLYSRARVEAIEDCEEWKQAQRIAAVRVARGKAQAALKASELVEQARLLPISVQYLAPDILKRRAIASYNAYRTELLCERGYEYEPATDQSDPAFLVRITVNYIRHNLTRYDSYLEELAGKTGIHQAIQIIRVRVYEEIARCYPEFAEECRRQMVERQCVPA